MSGWCGGRWQLGLACRIEAAWWVGGVLACRVGSARWVGGGGVAGQDGGGSRARMGCNLQGLALCWGGEVGWRWWGVGAGWRWLTCMNGGFACRVGAAGWRWQHVASHVGADGSGEARRGVEVGAQAAGVRWEIRRVERRLNLWRGN
ncbi:hypothetical protein EDB89DRAFT_1914641, partial [Lactarius sanguifluus]